MTIINLIDRLCQVTGWNVTRLNKEAGISDRTSSAKRNATSPDTPSSVKDSFDLRVLRVACRFGATADALAVLFDKEPVPIPLLAAALYPDITGVELHGILSVDEHTTTNHPDPRERIVVIMTALRAASPPPTRSSHPGGFMP